MNFGNLSQSLKDFFGLTFLPHVGLGRKVVPVYLLNDVYEHQADAVISQANPVSATLYTVLDTTKNVRIISIMSYLTWATTQPNPLDIVVTVDGNSIVFTKANPASNTIYNAYWKADNAEGGQNLETAAVEQTRSFLLEGRSVKVEVRVTWATTQPTPLICRVKYAKK